MKVVTSEADVALFWAVKKSIDAAMSITDLFFRAVGDAVYKAKCSGFWLGSWATIPAEYDGIARTRTTTNYLVLFLNFCGNSARYWSDKTARLQSHAKLFKAHRFFIFGRASACNVFPAVILWYEL